MTPEAAEFIRLLPLLPAPHPEHHVHLLLKSSGFLISNTAYNDSLISILTTTYLIESFQFLPGLYSGLIDSALHLFLLQSSPHIA